MIADTDPDSSKSVAQSPSEPVLLLPSSPTNDDYFNNTNWQVPPDDSSPQDEEDDIVASTAIMRRYGSGLGNLGNTCFMNSTLQCLAHTDPLRKYFLSGAYDAEINTDNPLGTGGDLAIQFAHLMSEMWLMKSKNCYQQSTTNVCYPRDFKLALGKHASQFMGYDQHDSQEFATYLLDALHEDTNRITKKPYIEKPEQGEDETDEEAANKAWEVHKQREDSFVMENFMAQVKSRVKCCEPECGRVSTTFDPIMFLSVPIPGSSERNIPVVFVPLAPQQRPLKISVKVNKLALMKDLLQQVQERIQKEEGRVVALENMSVCDIWHNDIHSWYSMSKDVSAIRDTDEIAIYELTPLSEIQEIEKQAVEDAKDIVSDESLGLVDLTPRAERYRLDAAETARLDTDDQWMEELKLYVRSTYSLAFAFDPNRGTTNDRVTYHKKLVNFIDMCYKEVENEPDILSQKRGRDGGDSDEGDPATIVVSSTEPESRGIVDRCDAHKQFDDVKSLYHVTVLAFISEKMRAEIKLLEKDQKGQTPDGITIEVRMRKSGDTTTYRDQHQRIAPPLALRIPSTMTVSGLREELAKRLERSLKKNDVGQNIQVSDENDAQPAIPANGEIAPGSSFGSPSLLVLRQIPLSCQGKSGGSRTSHLSPSKQLGSLGNVDSHASDSTKPISLASSSDEEEKVCVADVVGDHSTVYLDWPSELAEQHFDITEYEHFVDLDANLANKDSATITVQDCIDKFCQEEQLEESEMWYCNRCKQHVRAWKQFHIYKSPPILLIHLKRFEYTARSHRSKINTFIDFPLKNLDLTDHVVSWTEEEKPIYDCYAVSNHYGGLGGGHYTAYCLNDDNEWCYYDDSRITTEVDPKDVVSEAAYVLYYRRRDVPVGEEFVMKSYTPGSEGPALILTERGRDADGSEASSNAAMVGDDMDIEDIEDAVTSSRATSLMGSIDGDPLAMEGESDVENSTSDTALFPLQ